MLGQIFTPEADQDLALQYTTLGGELLFGTVQYGEIPEFGGGGFAADFNSDLRVDGDDFLVWQTGFGQFNDGSATQGDGDADDNGVVNGDDFLVWQAQFGSGVGGGLAAGGVPEPSALLLLALSVGLVALRGLLR